MKPKPKSIFDAVAKTPSRADAAFELFKKKDVAGLQRMAEESRRAQRRCVHCGDPKHFNKRCPLQIAGSRQPTYPKALT